MPAFANTQAVNLHYSVQLLWPPVTCQGRSPVKSVSLADRVVSAIVSESGGVAVQSGNTH